MRKQPDQDLFVCASAGNHAQGVAFMCKHMGKRGVIFMPVTTPQQKIQKTRMFGGENVEIHLVGTISTIPWQRPRTGARAKVGISCPPLTMMM